jgi:hypothetical protein
MLIASACLNRTAGGDLALPLNSLGGSNSPAEVQSVEVVPAYGGPDPERICTSIVERSNLNLRMGIRRFTRLTNAIKK